MNLDDAQKRIVSGWIAEGCKLSDIQSRLATELGIKLTYMEVRFLVDDLKLVPKDIDRPKPVKDSLKDGAQQKSPAAGSPAGEEDITEEEFPEEAVPAPGAAKVSVTTDKVTRPGSVVSGNVTFSDGNTAQWYLDQFGRLGLVSQKQRYKPTAADVQAFQIELQKAMQKMGY